MSEITGADFYAPLGSEPSLTVAGCTLSDGTVIFDTLTVSGNSVGTVADFSSASSDTVLVGTPVSRRITVSKGNFVLSGMTMSDKNSESVHGGALKLTTDGLITINGSTFSGNGTVTQDTRGGAIHVNSGQVNIVKSWFHKNISYSHGGAIYFDTGCSSVNVYGSTFVGNISSISSAGAVFVTGDYTANFVDTLFQENYAASKSGAVQVQANVNMYGCTFTGNTTAGDRGNLTTETGVTLTLDGCYFYNNLNLKSTAGAAVYLRSNYASVVEISNTVFSGNIANNDTSTKGAIFVGSQNQLTLSGNMQFLTYKDGISGTGSLTITDAVVTMNSTIHSAATVNNTAFIFGNTTATSIASMTFSGENSLSFTGNATVSFTSQNFDGAVLLDDDYENGDLVVAKNLLDLSGYTAAGAVREFGDIYLSVDKKRMQTAGYADNAITVTATDEIIIGGSEEGFGKYAAFSDFGFIDSYTGKYKVAGDVALGSVIASGAALENNAAITIDGAALLTGDKNIAKVFSISGENLSGTGSFAVKDAGYYTYTADDGVYVVKGTAAAIVSTDGSAELVEINGEYYFGNGYADAAGAAGDDAAIIVLNDAAKIADVAAISGKTVILNNLTASGQDITTNSVTKIYGGSFSGNADSTNAVITAKKDIHIGKSGDDAAVFSNIVNKCVVYAYGCNLFADGVQFIGNKSSTGSAVIYFSQGTQNIISNSLFKENQNTSTDSNKGKSGVFRSGNSATIITLQNNTFEGNSAKTGGVFYFENGNKLNSSGNTYKKNTSTGNGGVFSTKHNISFSGDKFIGNIAGGNGIIHGVSNYTLTVAISNCEFTGNTVKFGTVYAVSSFTIENSQFSGNVATGGYGGAVYVYNGTTNLTGKVEFLTSSDSVAVNSGAVLNINNAQIFLNAALTGASNGAYGTTNVTDSTITFGNEALVSVATLTFSGAESNIVLQGGEVDFTGLNINSGKVNFSGNALFDVGAVAITVDGTGRNAGDVIATGVTGTLGVDDYISNRSDLYLAIDENSNLVLKANTVVSGGNTVENHTGYFAQASNDGTGITVTVANTVNYTESVYMGSAGGKDSVIQSSVSAGTFEKNIYGGGTAAAVKTDMTIDNAAVSVGQIVFGGVLAEIDNDNTALAESKLTITAGNFNHNIVGGCRVNVASTESSATHTTANVVLTLSGGEYTKNRPGSDPGVAVYSAGYVNGPGKSQVSAASEHYHSIVKSNRVILNGADINGAVYGGAFTCQGGRGNIVESTISVSAGKIDRVLGGGWAQSGSHSRVESVSIEISGGAVELVYAGGASTADSTSYVDNAAITVSGTGSVEGIFMGGKYLNSTVGSTTVTINGEKDNYISFITGRNGNGKKITESTELVVDLVDNGTLTINEFDYVDKVTIHEGSTLDVNILTLNGEDKLDLNFVLDDADFNGEWEVLSGITLEQIDNFAINSTLVTLGDNNVLMCSNEKLSGLYRLDVDADAKTVKFAAVSK